MGLNGLEPRLTIRRMRSNQAELSGPKRKAGGRESNSPTTAWKAVVITLNTPAWRAPDGTAKPGTSTALKQALTNQTELHKPYFSYLCAFLNIKSKLQGAVFEPTTFRVMKPERAT